LGCVVALVRMHRLLLVSGTTGLAIAGSRVASNPLDFVWVCLLIAFGVLLWVSDVCRVVDERSVLLARDTKVSYSKATSDYLRGADFLKIVVALVCVVVLLVAATLLWIYL
jgi:hypothetical protein